MGWRTIATVPGLVLAACLFASAAAADPAQTCLTPSSDKPEAPDLDFHKDRIAACTTALESETVPERRVPLLFSRSESYFRTKSFVRSLVDLQSLQDLNADSTQLVYDRALSYGRLGYFTLSLALADTAIAGGMAAPEGYMMRGGDEAFVGRFGEAIEDLDRALSENPSLAGAYSARGFAYLEIGDIDRALLDLNEAIRRNPTDGGAYFNRGRAHYAIDQYQDAVADFQQAARLMPKELGPGEYIDELKGIMAADVAPPDGPPPADAPSRAVGRTHNCGGYYPYLSDRLLEAGNVLIHYDVSQTGAVSGVGLERTSGNDRLDRAAVVCVGRHWRNTPAYRGGVAVASPHHVAMIQYKAYQPAPTDTFQVDALAAMARYDEAVAGYSRILTITPDDAELYLHRGLANYVAGHYDDATRDFDKAVSLKPDYDEAIAAHQLERSPILPAQPVHGGN